MNVLFVHQGFPGQYRHILRALAAQGGHQLVGMGLSNPSETLPDGVHYVRYGLKRGNTPGTHPWIVESETKVLRGEACAASAAELRDQGFLPDLICAHPGWGESLFLKDIWADAPILSYQEFFYHARGVDYDFDPEQQGTPSWQDCAYLRMKNANLLLNLQASDWNVTPTAFQRSTFPAGWRDRISCIHDGIDTVLAAPDEQVAPLTLPDGTVLRRGEPVVTFVNRRVEPYRGCHTFLRALPRLQQLQPEARVVIVGEQEGVSYGKPAPGGSWKTVFLKELEGQIDLTRVHFTGSLAYGPFLKLLRITAAHVYLTYPFVLSWSLLEAMSSQAPVVGSATAPVQEVIADGVNGLLVNFFDPDQLAGAIDVLLRDRSKAQAMGVAARQTILKRYALNVCLPQQLSLLQLVASRALK